MKNEKKWILRKKYVRRIIAVLLLIGVCIPYLSLADFYVYAQDERKTVRIAFPQTDAPELYDIDENGNPSGMMYEYFETLNKFAGWNIEYVTGSMDELYEQLLEGSLDIMGTMSYDESLAEQMEYADIVSGYSYTALYTSVENRDIIAGDFLSFDGKTVAVPKGGKRKIEKLQKFCETNQITLNYKYYEDSDTLLKSLDNKEADMMIAADLSQNEKRKMVACFSQQPYYTVVAKGHSDVLRDLNQALFYLLQLRPGYDAELYQKYMKITDKLTPYLSRKEMEFIRDQKNITVVLAKEDPLISEYDGETRKYSGILPDILYRIQNMTGLKFEYQMVDTHEQAVEMVKNKEADLMGADQAQMNQTDFYYTHPYLSLPILQIQNVSQNPDKGWSAVKVGNPENSTDEITYCRSYKECIELVNRDPSKMTAMDSYTAQHLMRQDKYVHVNAITIMNEKAEFSFGMGKESSRFLMSVLEKAIHTLSSKDINNLLTTNLANVEETRSFAAFMRRYPSLAMLMAGLFVLIAVGIVSAFFIVNIKKRAWAESIEERKKHEKELAEALRSSEKASREKSDFLSRMSHDIRTPMNGIIGMTVIAQANVGDPQKVKECLKKITASSRHLFGLLNDILDMSKIENEKMILQNESFCLEKLIQEIQAIIAVQTEEKHQQFIVRADGLIHKAVRGDCLRIQQICLNLLSNAFKFTDQDGTILFEVTEGESSRPGYGFYSFVVEDNGIGMPDEFLKNVFLPFERMDSERISKTEGSGLGMAIAKNIIELMQGEIHVESRQGKGTKVSFQLQLEIEPDEQFCVSKENKEDVIFSDIRVLLAEDNELNQEIATELLKMLNVFVKTAEDGKQAVDMFQSSEEGYYHLIFMDIRMPGMDGYQAAQEIRKMKRKDANIPIIAMTANAFPEDVEKALASGMNAHLAKPIDLEKLRLSIEQWS